MLLGLAPTDYDVATDATPPEVMRIFPETYAVGAQFGVVLVPLKTPTQAKRLRLRSNQTKIPTQAKPAWAGHPAQMLLPSIPTTSRWPPSATMAPTPTVAIPIR